MQRISAALILVLILTIYAAPYIAQAQSDGTKIAGDVVSKMKDNTKGLSKAMADAISYGFGFIGLVMCIVGFYQLFFGEGSKVKAIYLLIGSFACLGIGGVVMVFIA